MPIDTIPQKIAEKDFDLLFFVKKTLQEKSVRDEIVVQMINNPDIMVYYHCFYVLEEAISRNPELFYPYWTEISILLYHPNSYHRDFALTLLAGLISVDDVKCFEEIGDKYFSLLYDPKLTTALCCLRGLGKILYSRPDLLPRVMTLLMQHEKTSFYPPKQEALFNADVLLLIKKNFSIETIPPVLLTFIERQKTSLSPKTRKLANMLLKELSVT